MKTYLGRVVILVKDQDRAFEFYEKNFGCKKLHDSISESGKRYLHVAFMSDLNCGLWFLLPETEEGNNMIGEQTAGHPTLVIYTDEIEVLYESLIRNKVTITEKLKVLPGSKFFHCLDLYGNILTVVEVKTEQAFSI
jgi:predicted enzyme related to lactoylglutathione lyase